MTYNLTGSMDPVYDRLTDSIYVSDGLGTAYPAIRLRRLDFSTGTETGSARLGNCVRCLTFSPDEAALMCVLDHRLVALDRHSLARIQEWKSRVPRYGDYCLWVEDCLYLINAVSPPLSRFGLKDLKCSRKRIGSGVGIFRRGPDKLLVCSGKEGCVYGYAIAGNVLTKEIETSPFKHAAYCAEAGLLLLGMGDPFELTQESIRHFRDSHDLRIYRLQVGGAPLEVHLKAPFRGIALNAEGTFAYLFEGGRVVTFGLSRSNLTQLAETILPKGFSARAVIPERSAVVAVTDSWSGPSAVAALTLN